MCYFVLWWIGGILNTRIMFVMCYAVLSSSLSSRHIVLTQCTHCKGRICYGFLLCWIYRGHRPVSALPIEPGCFAQAVETHARSSAQELVSDVLVAVTWRLVEDSKYCSFLCPEGLHNIYYSQCLSRAESLSPASETRNSFSADSSYIRGADTGAIEIWKPLFYSLS